MKLNLVLVAFAVFFTACVEAEDDPISESGVISTEQILDETRADRIVQWRVRHSDTTFWFQPGFEIENRIGKVTGRTSRNILSLQSKFQSGETLAVKVISARKFIVHLNEDQIVKAATGDAIITTVQTSVGKRHVFTRFAPRLNRFEGDHRIYVLRSINAVYVADNLMFRGRVNTAAGWELKEVRSAQKDGEIIAAPTLVPFDFDAKSMVDILSDSAKLTFNAHDGARQYITKNANFGLRLIKFAAADLPPSQAWPAESCHPEVHACLRNYRKDDFETCGYANQVLACWGPHAVDFSRRLKAEITHLYDTNPRRIRSLQGRSKAAALAKISPNNVGYVDPLESEDDALTTTDDIVVYHPGVIYRSSSTLWRGHYDKSGTFGFIEKVN